MLITRNIEWGPGWVWPVPRLAINGRSYLPHVSDGVGTARPDGRSHRGVDVMYQRAPGDRAEFTSALVDGVRNGSAGNFAPPGTPVLAARGGTVWAAGETARGGTVVLDHGKPFATYYTHLASLAVPETKRGRTPAGVVTRVRAGDVIGYMGADPLDAAHLRHLHFEVWHKGGPEAAVDPERAMGSWPVVSTSVARVA